MNHCVLAFMLFFTIMVTIDVAEGQSLLPDDWIHLDNGIVEIGEDPCDSNPCQNGATCVSNDDKTSVSCTCASGYKGVYCENDLCVGNECQNGATCVVVDETNTYSCTCAAGFKGTRCGTELSAEEAEEAEEAEQEKQSEDAEKAAEAEEAKQEAEDEQAEQAEEAKEE